MFRGIFLAPWDKPAITYCPEVPYQRTIRAPIPPGTNTTALACPPNLPVAPSRVREASKTTTTQAGTACLSNPPRASSLIQEPSSPETNCPICLTTFTRPIKTMPCAHSFCFECLQHTFACAEQVRCPLCRTRVVGQQPDKAVRELLRQARESKGEEEPAEERGGSIFPARRTETELYSNWARAIDDDDPIALFIEDNFNDEFDSDWEWPMDDATFRELNSDYFLELQIESEDVRVTRGGC